MHELIYKNSVNKLIYPKYCSTVISQMSFLSFYEWNKKETNATSSFNQKRLTQLYMYRLFNHPQGCPTIIKYFKISQVILNYNSSFKRIKLTSVCN
jgi:hypothetical protein